MRKEVNLFFLRIFWYIAYAYASSDFRSKLDAKFVKCTFIGYGGDEFGYRLREWQNRKVICSIDVVFNEHILYTHRLTVSSLSSFEPQVIELGILNSSRSKEGPDVEKVLKEELSTPTLSRPTREQRALDMYSPSKFIHSLLTVVSLSAM